MGIRFQALKTKAELERLGVDVDMLPIDELDGIPEYDVAHIFNIQMPEATMAAYDALQRRNIPIVLSSMYRDMIPHWYELAVTDGPGSGDGYPFMERRPQGRYT